LTPILFPGVGKRMDREEKGILKENRERKGFPIIPYPCPPYRAAPYMAIYARMYAPLLPPYMVMYARMYAPLLPHCCSHGAHVRPHIWPVAALVYGPFLPL